MAFAWAADACQPEGMVHGLHSKQDEHFRWGKCGKTSHRQIQAQTADTARNKAAIVTQATAIKDEAVSACASIHIIFFVNEDAKSSGQLA